MFKELGKYIVDSESRSKFHQSSGAGDTSLAFAENRMLPRQL